MGNNQDRGKGDFLRWEHSYLCDWLKKLFLTKSLVVYRSSEITVRVLFHAEPLIINSKGADQIPEYCHDDPSFIDMFLGNACREGEIPA